MPHINESEYGLLPTPMAQSRETTAEQTIERQKKYGGKTRAMYLENFAVMGMLPTPTAVQRDHPERVQMLKETGAKTMMSRLAGNDRPNSIMDAVNFYGMLHTPKACDYKNQAKSENWKGLDLSSQVKELTGTNSRLNPRFVAEMMGFPENWTESPFLSGETKVSKPTVTP
jgi:hypothetical protein